MSDLVHMPDSNCCATSLRMLTRSTVGIAGVTCHACLEELVRAGDRAAARVVELEREAARESSGGTCAHASVFQCTWCDDLFCLERACRARVPSTDDQVIKAVAAQCPECAALEEQIQEHPWPPSRTRRVVDDPNVGRIVAYDTRPGMMVSLPGGLAAFSVEHRSQHENRRAARRKLRALLSPEAMREFLKPPARRAPRVDDLQRRVEEQQRWLEEQQRWREERSTMSEHERLQAELDLARVEELGSAPPCCAPHLVGYDHHASCPSRTGGADTGGGTDDDDEAG